jgi:catecholate siderophore receptor
MRFKIRRKVRKRNRGFTPKHGRALIVGAVGAAIACAAPAPGAAMPSRPLLEAFETARPGRQERGFQFDITPGMIDEVIARFEAITGTDVSWQIESIADLASPGVQGAFTTTGALEALLAGTDLAYERVSGDLFFLELSAPATSIDVAASLLSSEPASVKYTQPIRDIPQTITIIPSTLIEQQGATSLRDVLSNVPGITMAAGEGGQPAGDNLTVRGFSARNDIFIDGVRDLGTQSRDAFNLEQVEVAKGPGSAYTGRGSTGGSINLVTKIASLAEAFSGSVMLGNADTKRISADANLPVPALGERTGFRLNLMWSDSGVPGRDVVRNEKWGVAPTMTFGLNTPTELTLAYSHLDQDSISDYGIPWVPANNNVLVEHRDRPAPVPRNTFYGFRDRDFERMKADTATVSLRHQFTDAMSLAQQVRYGNSSRDSVATPPRFAGPDSTDINRGMRAWRTNDDVWNSQTHLLAGFDTGTIDHSFVTGLELSHETNARQNGRAPNVQTSLLDPDADEPFDLPAEYGDTGDVTGNTVAVYAFDTASLGERVDLTGGLRWERFDVNGFSRSLEPVEQVDTMHSLRGGVVYHPRENGSLYVSYSTALNPTLEGLNYSVGGGGAANLDPERTYALEAGTKWDTAGGRLLMSGSFFRVEKTNARTPGVLPDSPPEVLEGRQRSTGVELGATGTIMGNWVVFGAYTFMDAKIVESNDPSDIGQVFQNAPRHSGNVWSTFRIGDLEFGGGIRFVGERYGSNPDRRVDSYWTADLMASHPVHANVDLRLNVYNVNDAYYFDRIGGGHVVPGPGRAFTVNTAFRF